MAKQKKKKKKIKRKELPKKDKILYFITSNIPTAVIFVLSILGDIYFKKIINKLFYDENILYSQPLTNGITVLLLLLLLASGLIHYFTLSTYDISFKDYIIMKSDVGRRILKFFTIYFTVLCIAIGICSYLQIYSRRDADNDIIYNNHLIASDTVTEYKEIDSAKLYVAEKHHRIRSSYIYYDAVVSVDVNGKEIKFEDDYFDDYAAMQDFIDCIGNDKVKIDTKYVDKLIKDHGSSDEKDIKRLFCID